MRSRPLRALFVLALVAAAPATAATTAGTAGSGGLGDPFFPGAGNGGYRVSHYGVALNYRPASNSLKASVRILARATQDLRSFHLDFRGPPITALTVDGGKATYRRAGSELIVRPAQAIADKQAFRVDVAYAGHPGPVIDPDASSEGWIRTDDGAFVVGEPLGTSAWIPSNNHPSDKATFSTSVTVPSALSAISNGRLLRVSKGAGVRTFHWREGQPMATYLATVDIGLGRLERSQAVGVPVWTLVDPRESAQGDHVLKKLPSILRFEQKIYGRYPFDSAGAIIDHDAGVGYALETQTRPIFDGAPNLTTLVHEQAHQWFGDSVTLRTWPDIWLHEGFATWTEWYYAERHGGQTAARIFRRLYASPADRKALWDPPAGDPGKPADLFASSVYYRGAMTLQALRETIGDKDFFRTLRTWQTTRRHANGSIKQFIKLAEKTSGRGLGPFFKRWLFTPGKPPGGPLATSRGLAHLPLERPVR